MYSNTLHRQLARPASELTRGYAVTAASRTLRLRSDRRLARLRRSTLGEPKPRPKLADEIWHRPLAPDVLPAFDEALKFLEEDSVHLKEQAKLIEEELSTTTDEQKISELQARLENLQVESEIHLPQTLWRVRNGLSDRTRLVDRAILEHIWRKEGPVSLLMERIHQMHVVPDILPDFSPSIDLRVSLNKPQVKRPTKGAPKVTVEPGTFVEPLQTALPPRLHVEVFHPDERLYTLLMVDPDVPDQQNETYQQYLHWLQPNIALSAATAPKFSSLDDAHTAYIPPHPQKGTPYHRYTILLLPQTSRIDVPSINMEDRLGFNTRQFVLDHHLKTDGGGAHMFREIWAPYVSKIYETILKSQEPVFGKPKVPDVAELKRRAGIRKWA